MLKNRVAFAVIICLAITLIESKLESAEVHLIDRFFVPVSVHVNCLRSNSMFVEPLELKSLEDVVVFYKHCNQIKFNQESVTSLRFFEEIGLKVQAEELVPPPKVPNQQIIKEPIEMSGPRWLPTALDFDQSRHASDVQFNGYRRRKVTGPGVGIYTMSSDASRQVTHSDRPASNKKIIDSSELFSRSDRWLDQNAIESSYQGFSLYSVDYEKVTQYFLAETGRDSICARITISKSKNRPSIITFHLGLTPYEHPKPYTLPSLTLVFRGTSTIDKWKLQGYFFQEVSLDEPLLDVAFTVPLNLGDTFVGVDSQKKNSEVRKVVHEYEDITQVVPQEVIRMQDQSMVQDQEVSNQENNPKWLIASNIIIVLAIGVFVAIRHFRRKNS